MTSSRFEGPEGNVNFPRLPSGASSRPRAEPIPESEFLTENRTPARAIRVGRWVNQTCIFSMGEINAKIAPCRRRTPVQSRNARLAEAGPLRRLAGGTTRFARRKLSALPWYPKCRHGESDHDPGDRANPPADGGGPRRWAAGPSRYGGPVPGHDGLVSGGVRRCRGNHRTTRFAPGAGWRWRSPDRSPVGRSGFCRPNWPRRPHWLDCCATRASSPARNCA